MTGATEAVSRKLRTALLVFFALALVSSSSAGASNASLKRTLATWSHRIGADARGIGLSATRRHPRRMTRRANHFRHDALLARRALAAQRASTPRGQRSRRLAVVAFHDYAVVGSEWALSGRARVRHRKALAARHSLIAKRFATRGNRLMIAAARLLR